jgi:peptide/nickel transport system ATP-binding protein
MKTQSQSAQGVEEEEEEILSIRNLCVEFQTPKAQIRAVDGINLGINAGEIFGVVGESGCGKSVTTLAIMGLLPANARVTSGEIMFEGTDLAKMSQKELAKVRATRIGMVFQDSSAALDPLYKVGTQVAEPLVFHQDATVSKGEKEEGEKEEEEEEEKKGGRTRKRKERLSKKEIRDRVIELLELVRIPDARKVAGYYPHQLSGGMKQRVMIATALALNPSMLILDEPTTALDVTIQDEILSLLKEIRAKFNTTILLISHDFGVIARMCNRVAVMYLGKIAEVAAVKDILEEPMHPYTKALLRSVPTLQTEVSQLVAIPGSVPNLSLIPKGCNFHNRCPQAMEICIGTDPLPLEMEEGSKHLVRCHLYKKTPPTDVFGQSEAKPRKEVEGDEAERER